MKETITLEQATLLSTYDDISARVIAPAGEKLEVLKPIYEGLVLLVKWDGKKWYVKNDGLAPSLITRKPAEVEAPPKVPWESNERARRGGSE